MSNTTTFSDNVFKVKTVAEDGTILHGFIKVTDTDLVFSERDTDTERCWPISNLRKYDYQKDFFVFEAVDDCHGGDGYHAFNTKQAAALYCMVNQWRIQRGSRHREKNRISVGFCSRNAKGIIIPSFGLSFQ